MQNRFVIVGNPENRRIELFQHALASFKQPPATVVSYFDLLQNLDLLKDAITPDTILRIESPGENFEVEKKILKLGEADSQEEGSPFLASTQVQQLEFDRGLILYPRQWFMGFRKLMQRVGQQLENSSNVRCMNHPADIIQFFDKRLCHASCLAAEVPVAEGLNPVRSFDELIVKMTANNWSRVFIKLAHGSSASGVVALQSSLNRMVAITSAEMVRSQDGVRLYNSLKLCRYTKIDDIRDLVDTLCQHHVHVERWLPKASLQHGTTFDLRVVVIDGIARHFVVRQSRSPLTNLHLGNRRGDSEQLVNTLGASLWKEVLSICEQAAKVYPDSLHIGVDLLLTPGFRKHYILELNAFGDLLPGVLHDGLDTYQVEIQSILRR